MLGTLATFLVLSGASALTGQALLAACGWRGWSGLAPAVGLAALCPLAWWALRGFDEGAAVAIVVAAGTGLAFLVLRRRPPVWRPSFAPLAVTLAALLAALLPFAAEGRFGILGTGLNPDMSQHLFAVDRLVGGLEERLITEGYPLGPHSLVVGLAELGPSAVEAFNGLTLAVAAAASLAGLALLTGLGGWRRIAGALCIGFAYLVAAYLVQGAFKEAMQALYVLAFAIGLRELAAGEAPSRVAGAVPLAVLALGSLYTYSFPGLAWLAGAAGIWAAIELGERTRSGGLESAKRALRRTAAAVLVALAVLAAGAAPELGRIADFASFETFNPSGDGLGNLFNRLSPLEALGIWPSGDFRVEPGDGAIPGFVFYLGAAAALVGLGLGLRWCWRRGERALPAALAAALVLWLYALIGGTPYQESKALVMVAPLVAAIMIPAALTAAPTGLAVLLLALTGGSGLLALANGQVGPGGYSPQLAELRTELGEGSVVVAAPAELLDEQHGRDYLVWELRGNRICVVAEGDAPPAGAFLLGVSLTEDGAVVPEGAYRNRRAGAGGGPCPFIPDGARADPGAAGG